MPTERYELIKGTTRKFWELDRAPRSLTFRWGKIGAEGPSKVKRFSSDEKAAAATAVLVAQKEKKGYRRKGITGSAPTTFVPRRAEHLVWVDQRRHSQGLRGRVARNVDQRCLREEPRPRDRRRSRVVRQSVPRGRESSRLLRDQPDAAAVQRLRRLRRGPRDEPGGAFAQALPRERERNGRDRHASPSATPRSAVGRAR